MLMIKSWERRSQKGFRRYKHVYTGWFLFGIIPVLIIRKTFEVL